MDAEARRRRIIEKGSSRMALITGRIQSLDPSSLSYLDSSPNPLTPKPSDFEVEVCTRASKVVDGELRQNLRRVPELEQQETNPEAFHVSGAQLLDKTPPHCTSPFMETLKNLYDQTETRLKPIISHLSVFTARDITSCITASEGTRIQCSVGIALFVVIFHLTFPFRVIGQVMFAIFKPLWVILLVDVTLVLRRLMLDKTEDSGRPNQKEGEESSSNWKGAIKFLESGIMLHQALRAIFIDCSFYVVIVTCGRSLC